MKNDQDAMEFLTEIETRRNGKISWKTYCTWFSDCINIRQFGVFLYKVGETFYYEDFERKPSFLGFEIKQKNAPKYEKLEGSFLASDVKNIVRLTKNRAMAFLTHQEREDKLRPSNGFERLFSQLVSMVELQDGSRLFFEFLDEKEFKKVINF